MMGSQSEGARIPKHGSIHISIKKLQDAVDAIALVISEIANGRERVTLMDDSVVSPSILRKDSQKAESDPLSLSQLLTAAPELINVQRDRLLKLSEELNQLLF